MVFFFAFLVCAFDKKPFEVTDHDRLYLKNYFEFFQAVKMCDSSDKLYKIRSTCKNQDVTPNALIH